MRLTILPLLLVFGDVPPLRDAPPLPKDTLDDAQLSGVSALGLPDQVPGVESTPEARARLELGRKLFFDPILSKDRTVSCASCHDPDKAFATNDARPLGVGGERCDRNSPPIFNRAFGATQFWDGRASTLEQQVLMPIEHPHEMALPLPEALARFAADPGYRGLFAATGAPEPTNDALAAALAEFVRRLVVGDSPIDRFRAAKGTLTPQERRGLWLWESKAGCWKCHAGPNFSDEKFHNTGIGSKDGVPEAARFAVTGDEADRGAWKTPTLRMVAKTAPYMHDGSLATLDEVVRFYARGGNPNAQLDAKVQPFEISDDDVAAMVAFMDALSRSGDPPPPPEETDAEEQVVPNAAPAAPAVKRKAL
ncbi:MAG: cytochrome-c peroxidase [Planctomycetes bacterium]|nr:cytochrome-c peroxidase [Planctomycetota bacterium]